MKTGFAGLVRSSAMKPLSQYATQATLPSARGSTLWPYSGSGSQPRPAAGGPPRLRCTPQLETSKGTAGFVTSISRKSPLPCWSRRPLGEAASAYSLAGTLAYTKLRLRSARCWTSSSCRPRVQQPVLIVASSSGEAGLVTSNTCRPRKKPVS